MAGALGIRPADLMTGAGSVATGVDAPQPGQRRYGRLGLQLALLLLFVSLGAVVAANVVAGLTVYASAQRTLQGQETAEARAAALGAAVTYQSGEAKAAARGASLVGRDLSWARALNPVIVVASRSGSAMLVRDASGRLVRASPGYAVFPAGPSLTEPVMVRGLRVGSVTVKFDDHGIGRLIGHFGGKVWGAGMIAIGVGALFAIVVAFFVAPLIARPVDRLLMTAWARGAGKPQSRVGRIRGLGDLRELAATFDQMADSLGQQDQLRRNLVSNVAHELRTPVAVLQASTEAMSDGVTPPTIDNVRSLHDEAVRLGQLTDDLQRLASAEAAALRLRVTPCDLADLAARAVTSLADIFGGGGVRLTRQLEPVWAPCDPVRMHEVITNLLTNAAKFTPAGGGVVVETRQAGNAAVLTVTDTGVGISAEELPRLSERFYRGRESAQVSGSGIGLAIVEELVRAHRATMDISSVPGQGTRVTIRLPLIRRV